MPNADTGNRQIRAHIQQFLAGESFESLRRGESRRRSLCELDGLASAMVGNSSSGIIEAASFKLPVVNIGIRQAGRMRAKNVIDVGNSREEIVAGITRALDPSFRASLEGMKNPYATGCAVGRIIRVLKEAKIDARLLQKHFYDIPATQPNAAGS